MNSCIERMGSRGIPSVTEPCHDRLLSSRDSISRLAWLALGKLVAATSATAIPISSVVLQLAMPRGAGRHEMVPD